MHCTSCTSLCEVDIPVELKKRVMIKCPHCSAMNEVHAPRGLQHNGRATAAAASGTRKQDEEDMGDGGILSDALTVGDSLPRVLARRRATAFEVNEQPYTWQEHLIGWRVEIKQGAAGAASLGAVVRRWNEAMDTFTLCFENGLVESGPLPHPLASLVRDGLTIEWNAFFERCAG